jgi:hypothetical protein
MKTNIINSLVASTPMKNMKVSWDYYSQYMGKIKNVPNHQPNKQSMCSTSNQSIVGFDMGNFTGKISYFPAQFTRNFRLQSHPGHRL